MPTYPVRITTDSATVTAYLTAATLDPPIQNAATRVPQLIGCNGVVHYTRSGTRTVVSQGSFEIRNGDFLVVADQCATGTDQAVVVAPMRPGDYAFIMGSGDDFYDAAEYYMDRRPNTTTVTSAGTLEAILNTLMTGGAVTTPIANVIVVSHARQEGQLAFAANARARDDRMYLDELCMYVHDRGRPQITTRTIRNASATNIHIRGCNIGEEDRFLRLIRQIFGAQVTVTAPKHEDRYFELTMTETRGEEVVSERTYYSEFMRYNFVVKRKQRASNKNELVRHFFDLRKSDIHGNRITRAQYRSWIPNGIHPQGSVERRHRCGNPIHARAGQYITRRYRYQRKTLYTYGVPWQGEGAPPANPARRTELLREALRREPTMQANHPSQQCDMPRYQRWGYGSLNDFVDSLSWSFSWNAADSILMCTGRIHEYELRIPITDAQNNLLMNVFEGTGTRQYLHQEILETNGELFGRV